MDTGEESQPEREEGPQASGAQGGLTSDIKCCCKSRKRAISGCWAWPDGGHRNLEPHGFREGAVLKADWKGLRWQWLIRKQRRGTKTPEGLWAQKGVRWELPQHVWWLKSMI